MKLDLLLSENLRHQQQAKTVGQDIGINPDTLLEIATDIDPTDRKSLVPWILNIIGKSGLESINRIRQTVQDFIDLKDVVPDKDIFRYKSLEQLEEIVEQYRNVSGKRKGGTGKYLLEYEGVTLIKTIGNVELYGISSSDSLADIAESTRWCVRRSYPDCKAERYIEQHGTLYLLLNKGKIKALISPDFIEIMDTDNKPYYTNDEDELSAIAYIPSRNKSSLINYIVQNYLDNIQLIANELAKKHWSKYPIHEKIETVPNGIIETIRLAEFESMTIDLTGDNPKLIKLRKILEPVGTIDKYELVNFIKPMDLIQDDEISTIIYRSLNRYSRKYKVRITTSTDPSRPMHEGKKYKLMLSVFHDFSDTDSSFIKLPYDEQYEIIDGLSELLSELGEFITRTSEADYDNDDFVKIKIDEDGPLVTDWIRPEITTIPSSMLSAIKSSCGSVYLHDTHQDVELIANYDEINWIEDETTEYFETTYGYYEATFRCYVEG